MCVHIYEKIVYMFTRCARVVLLRVLLLRDVCDLINTCCMYLCFVNERYLCRRVPLEIYMCVYIHEKIVYMSRHTRVVRELYC